MPPPPAPGAETQLTHYTDADGQFACPRCDATTKPRSFHSQTYRLDRETSYDFVVIVCAACQRDSVLIRRWGFQSSHAVADTGDFIENYAMHASVDTTTAWIRRVSTPFGRRLARLPNTPEPLLLPYRAACQTIEASPEAAAALARQCLHMILGGQGYTQEGLISRIDAATRDMNPKKRLPAPTRATLDLLRRYPTLSDPGHDLINPADVHPAAPGEAEAALTAIEQLMDYYFEAPNRIDTELEALRRSLASSSKT